ILGKIPIGADFPSNQVRNDLFVRRAETEVPLVSILESEHLLADQIPSPAFLPELRRMHGGEINLLRPGSVHLLPNQLLHFADHSKAEGEERINSSRHLTDHAAPKHEPMARHFRFGRIFLQRGTEEARKSHSGETTRRFPQSQATWGTFVYYVGGMYYDG